VAAGLVAPVGDVIKAGEVDRVDFGKEKEEVRVAERGRDCCCCCCIVKWVERKGVRMTYRYPHSHNDSHNVPNRPKNIICWGNSVAPAR
jgi:hypothetical protein